MKTFIIQVLAILFVIFAGMIITFNPQLIQKLNPFDSPGRILPTTNTETVVTPAQTKIRILDATSNSQLVIAKGILDVEVADDKDERSAGLSNRQSLATDSGMLFIFSKPDRPRFWMKGLNFPLDFIWIKGDRIVDILENVPAPAPNTPDAQLPLYEPTTDIDKVLEVNAGYVKAHNIRVGDTYQQLPNQ